MSEKSEKIGRIDYNDPEIIQLFEKGIILHLGNSRITSVIMEQDGKFYFEEFEKTGPAGKVERKEITKEEFEKELLNDRAKNLGRLKFLIKSDPDIDPNKIDAIEKIFGIQERFNTRLKKLFLENED